MFNIETFGAKAGYNWVYVTGNQKNHHQNPAYDIGIIILILQIKKWGSEKQSKHRANKWQNRLFKFNLYYILSITI